MEAFVTLILLALLVEAVVEWIKKVFGGWLAPILGETWYKVAKQFTALAVGILLAFGAGQNIFVLLGTEFLYPVVGYVLAGLFIARGSNYIHDFGKQMQDKHGASID